MRRGSNGLVRFVIWLPSLASVELVRQAIVVKSANAARAAGDSMKFVYTLGLICTALLAPPGTQPTSLPIDKNGLPMPTLLGVEQARAGNPLGEYLELLKHEKEYDASEQWRQMYWDIPRHASPF